PGHAGDDYGSERSGGGLVPEATPPGETSDVLGHDRQLCLCRGHDVGIIGVTDESGHTSSEGACQPLVYVPRVGLVRLGVRVGVQLGVRDRVRVRVRVGLGLGEGCRTYRLPRLPLPVELPITIRVHAAVKVAVIVSFANLGNTYPIDLNPSAPADHGQVERLGALNGDWVPLCVYP